MVDLHDVAYTVVRIIESYVYLDRITGEEPGPAGWGWGGGGVPAGCAKVRRLPAPGNASAADDQRKRPTARANVWAMTA
ncbi:MAG: hypothetical protein ACR2JH_03190 [Solirubrobacteraceae bacterium]